MESSLVALARGLGRDKLGEALDLLRELARIPAPSHDEGRRAAFVCDWMHANGLRSAYVDEATNVICPLADDGTRDLVVFAAHMDVVFADTDELPLGEDDTRMFAPGVGDDTANLVSLMICARELARRPELLPDDVGVLVVANSCEEGLGNLKGTRRVFDAYGGRVRRFYSFDLYLPQVIDQAVGSHRWRIDVRTQGGHSFKDFGRPNAIERLCAIIRDLYALDGGEGAPYTLNVGTIEGGTTVNAIAGHAQALFEYRSTSDEVLQDLRARMDAVIDAYRTDEVSVGVTCVGIRPASAAEAAGQRRMTEATRDVMRSVIGEEPYGAPASTDANIPLSRGVPANTVGAVRGALLHTRDEWISKASLEEGIAVIMGVMLAQDGLDAGWPRAAGRA